MRFTDAPKVRRVFVCTMLFFSLPSETKASQVAADNAADPAYNAGWSKGSNGGSGWASGWSGFDPDGAPLSNYFMGSSTTNGAGDPDGDGDINTPRTGGGRAWGLTSPHTPDGYFPAGATRTLSGPLAVGQTIKIDMDNGLVDVGPQVNSNWEVGWELTAQTNSFSTIFPLKFRAFGNQADYMIEDALGNVTDTGVAVTDQGVHCEFTLTGIHGFTLSVTPLITGGTTHTLTGTIAQTSLGITDLSVYSFGGGTGADHAVYFNNIAVTPEPNALSTIGVAGLACLILQRRRKEALQPSTREAPR